MINHMRQSDAGKEDLGRLVVIAHAESE